jgi:hypothetical protein
MMAIGTPKSLGGLMALGTLLVTGQIHSVHPLNPAWAGETGRPPIDRAAPKNVETATFAMG